LTKRAAGGISLRMGLLGIAFLVALGWFVAKAMGLDGDTHDRQRRINRHDYPSLPEGRSTTIEFDARTEGPRASLPPRQLTREEKAAELRRRYVADEITVEEYEEALDRLLREKPET